MRARLQVEMMLKIIALGFWWCGPTSYLKDGWNILDFCIVMVGLMSWVGMARSIFARTVFVLACLIVLLVFFFVSQTFVCLVGFVVRQCVSPTHCSLSRDRYNTTRPFISLLLLLKCMPGS